MSLVARYTKARERFGLEPGADRRQLKRAYRAQVIAHPPDRDPDTFREIRAAFELLDRPGEAARAMLLGRKPAVAAPPVELPRVPRGTVALALLREVAGRLDAAALLSPPSGRGAAEETDTNG